MLSSALVENRIDSAEQVAHTICIMVTTVYSTKTELSVYTLDDLLRQVPGASADGADQDICLDLRNLHYMDLFSMVGILYTCHELVARPGCRVRLELSEDGACGFLPRVGFVQLVPGGVDLSDTFTPARLILEQASRGANPDFLELTPITSYDVICEVLDKLIHILRGLGFGKNDAFDMAIAFSEISQNILDHNEAAPDGLAAMQVYRGGEGKFFQFVVADRGVGILTTLRRNLAYADLTSDVRAIIASTGLGASEYSDGTRGNGLHKLLQLSDKHGGSVHIRSGSGRVYWRLDEQRRSHAFNVPYLPGVQIVLSFKDKQGA